MKYIRRNIINDIMGSPQKQKAVAFALLLKDKTNDSSVIRDFTVYKVHKLTGMAYKTIRKYVDVLIKIGLAEMKEGCLFIKKMTSSNSHRNICIANFRLDKNKNVFNQIRDLIFLIIQSHKDYIKSLLRLRDNPSRGTDYKGVRRLCRKCCKNPNDDYKENGLSYETISKRIGCCVKTAVNVVKDTVHRKWCTKKNNCEIHEMRGVNYREVPGYTFTSMNYGYIIRHNTYTMSPSWARALNALACVPVRK